MATPILDRDTILRAIQTWPRDEQVALAQDIMRRAGIPLVEEPLDPPDSQGLAGMLANGHPAPTGEQVERWLEEDRMNKYSG
ncbi:MAG TPA: hypothetical protein VID72_00270 [Ktedonobacterales bacterium]|jgi:hypothetical protein